MRFTLRLPAQLALATALSALTVSAHAERIYGASTTALVNFDSASPASFTSVNFSGVAAGQTIRSIDFRPATGTLYALSSSGAANTLYTVNLASGALTTVGAFSITGNASARISIDFNPTVDRLRVVTGSGFNYRVNPNDAAVAGVDTNLNTTDIISGIAYTNSVAGATSTTLYAYNFDLDTLNTIGGIGGTPSPNGGVVTSVGGTGGPSAFNAAIGFDISGATGVGYIAYDEFDSTFANSEFYTVNLGTGALTQIGANDVLPALVGLSVAPQAVPEPSAFAALGLGARALLRRRKRA